MSHQVAILVAGLTVGLAAAGITATAWAALVVSTAAAVYLAGPTVVCAGVAVIATRLPCEARATHVTSPGAASLREDRIATRGR